MWLAGTCQETGSVDYHKADSIALAFPKNKYYFYTETAEELVQNLGSEKEKCRAIFRWITNNVKYDFETRNNTEGQEPEVVYKRRKAVCQGYADLFAAMCKDAKISCLTISGLAGPSYESHTWNIVKLDGIWYIMGPTWAAGGMKGSLSNKFIKGFDEAWWMADYSAFIKTHHTEDSQWKRYIAHQTTSED